jgi:hypothetical protein
MKPLEIQNVIEEVTRRVIALSDSTLGNTIGGKTVAQNTEITVVGDKVISTQQLKDLPDGLAVIQIDSKSLITPAAADWLREHNIDVQRITVQATGEASKTVNARNKWVCLTLGSAAAGSESFNCIVKASKRCDEAISDGDRVVLVTDTASVALIALNRNPKLRAIEVRHVHELQKDANTTCANVFVVRKNSHQSARFINQIKLVAQHNGSLPDWL